VDELEDALARYRGTLVIASHDRALSRWFAALDGPGGAGRRLALSRPGPGSPGTRPARGPRP
jgi:macrolide transport system ATP-binding/permease protein